MIKFIFVTVYPPLAQELVKRSCACKFIRFATGILPSGAEICTLASSSLHASLTH